jgi:hypothetical protein
MDAMSRAVRTSRMTGQAVGYTVEERKAAVIEDDSDVV